MSEPEKPKPVGKIADDIVKDDVAKHGAKGRPGKKAEGHSSRVRLGGALAAAGLLAAVAVIAYLVTRDSGEPSSTPRPATPAAGTEPEKGSTLDPCLVGVWISRPLRPAPGLSYEDIRIKPGAGANTRITFEADGTETVDMSKTVPDEETETSLGANVWRGVVTGRITAHEGRVSASRVISSTGSLHLFSRFSIPPFDRTDRIRRLSDFGLSNDRSAGGTYTVDAARLAYRSNPFWTIELRRQTPPPPECAP